MKKIVVDLGGTNVKSGLVEDLVFLKTASTPTDNRNGREGVVSSIRAAIDRVFDPEAVEICISSAGRIDPESGAVLSASSNLPGYTGFNLYTWAKEQYGLPCVALNDGLAALLGEIAIHPEYGDKRVIMLTLGTGVGGAYSVNGKLKSDESNDYTHFCHYLLHEGGVLCNCGKRGCIEQYLSGSAINRRAAEAGFATDTVFSAFAKGDPLAKQVIEDFRADLALALRVIGERCPFDFCILGGGAADGMGDVFSSVTGGLGYDIRHATAGNRAGMLGAFYFSEHRK